MNPKNPTIFRLKCQCILTYIKSVLTPHRLLPAIAFLAAFNASAADVLPEEARSFIDANPAVTTESGVVVAAIATPAPVQMLKPVNTIAKMRVARKDVAQANGKAIPALMLSRSQRQQIALLSSNSDTAQRILIRLLSDNENDDGGFDDLPLHQFYSRPRVVDEDQDKQADALLATDKVRMRLLFARLKAMEAYALNQAPDDGAPLPSNVQSRLAEARAKALARHAELHAA